MGLDWCVIVYENRDEWSKDKGKKNEILKKKLDKMKDELEEEHEITLNYYRGNMIAYLLRYLEIEGKNASNLCYGKDVFDNDGKKRGPFLTDNQIEDIIEGLKFIKTSYEYIDKILFKKDVYYGTEIEIEYECNDAINFLEKVRDYDGDYFVKIWCWY
jgi:hypothetical protein